MQKKRPILDKVLSIAVLLILIAGCSSSDEKAGSEADTAASDTGTEKAITCAEPGVIGDILSVLDLSKITITSNIAKNTSVIHVIFSGTIQEFCNQDNPVRDLVLKVMDPTRGLIFDTIPITDVSIDTINPNQVNITVEGPVAQGSLLRFKNIRLPNQIIGGTLTLEGEQFMTVDAAALSFPVTGKSKKNLYIPDVYGGELPGTIQQSNDPGAAFTLMENQLGALVAAGFVTAEKKTEWEALFSLDPGARAVFTHDVTGEFAAFAMAAVLASGNEASINAIFFGIGTELDAPLEFVYLDDPDFPIAAVKIINGRQTVTMSKPKILAESFAVVSGGLALHEPLHQNDLNGPLPIEETPVGLPEEMIAGLFQNKNWGDIILAEKDTLFSQGNTSGTKALNFHLTLHRNSGSGEFNNRRVPGLNDAPWRNAIPDSNIPDRSASWKSDLRKFSFGKTPDTPTRGNPLLNTLISQRKGVQVPAGGFHFDAQAIEAIENSEGFTPEEWTQIGQTLGWELVLDPKPVN